MSRLIGWMKYCAGLRLAPSFVPSAPAVGPAMLKLAELQPGETLVDIGCGDGRLLQLAVGPQFGAGRAIGYELEDSLAAEARAACAADGKIVVHHSDALQAEESIKSADVVTVYLTEAGNAKILPMLQRSLRPRARVVSYVWSFAGLPPSCTARAVGDGVVLPTASSSFANILLWSQPDLCKRPESSSDPS